MNFLRTVDWYQWKLFAQHASGISTAALQVIVGVMLQLLVALLFKSSVARPMPLLAVLGFALVNAANDLRVEIRPDQGMQLGEPVKDIVLTMAVPTLLFLVARYRPRLLAQGSN